MHAGNRIRAGWAASLAPRLLRMTQLTSLNLSGTAACIGGQLRCERMLANAGCAWMLLRAVGLGGCARGCSYLWDFARVRADNQIEAAGVALLAPSLGRMAQLTSLGLSGTLRASALQAGACECRQCMDDAVGLGAVVRVAVAGGGGSARGRAEGRRCVQAMRMSSEMLEQRRWHRVSEG